FEGRVLGEPPPANLALERFHTHVRCQMLPQVRLDGELFPALLALVRFLALVQLQMHLQVRRRAQCLPTDVTQMQHVCVTLVTRSMLHEPHFTLKHFIARVTREFPRFVYLPVRRVRVRTHSFPANVANYPFSV